MRPMEQLQMYLGAVRRRLVASALLRGLAIALGAALVATVVLAAVTNRFAFSPASLAWSRSLLFLTLAFAVAFAVVMPVLAMNRRRAARQLEALVPAFGQRLLTCVESPPSPVLELLARDTVKIAREASATRIVPRARLASLGGVAAASLGALLWLILAGPGYFGHGAALLWGATPKNGGAAFYDIQVLPGDKLVRRKSNELIVAHLVGFQAASAKLKARYEGSSKWEEVAMMPAKNGGFEFLLTSIPEEVHYYVEAGHVRSRQHRITVADLPAVKRIKVTYQYPQWTGLPPAVEDPGGDLRAVEGTEADLEIEFDQPLASGLLVLDSELQIPLATAGHLARARVPIRQDGAYYVATVAEKQQVRLSDDYFIEARPETEPVIRLTRPGRDLKVSPIEEVTLEAAAQDDFGLREVAIHYSVNGGPEKTVSAPAGARSASVQQVLALEDFQLIPGDVVSVYATARDARTTARTDIYFLEAQPFEREYSQSQTSGGGGGGMESGEQNRIADRQKEIIAATWNEIRDKSGNRAKAEEDARFLAEVQAKLQEQAVTLAQRMKARQLAGAAESFQAFANDMESAAAAMGPAAEKLRARKWPDALPFEQQALQHLLRAEARFREIQVAFGNSGGGGGGQSGGRDLESLFDLELDTEKNQYETGQQAASGGASRQQEIDEAMQKLEQLARRQQELAQQVNRQQQRLPEQRWQQEQLRREVEQLQRQMQQLAQHMGQPGAPSGQRTPSGPPGLGGAGGSPTQQRLTNLAAGRDGQSPVGRDQSGIDPRIQRALDQLAQATEDMRRANQPGQANDAETRRAAERLAEARSLLGGLRREETSGQLQELARRAEQLAAEQRAFADNLRSRYGMAQSREQQDRAMMSQSREQNEQLAQEKVRLMEEYKRLERDLQAASRSMAGTRSDASNKLREALGNAQREEISLKMKYMSEWLRRGLGPYAWTREAPVTSALENLRDQLKEAAAAGPGQKAAQDGDGRERALSQLEQLRQQLDRASREATSARASGPASAVGAGPRSRSGEEVGEDSPSGQRAASGGGGPGGSGNPFGPAGGYSERHPGYGAMNTGDRPLPAGPLPPPGAILSGEQVQRIYNQSLRELRAMRQEFADSPETRQEIERLLREMQRLDPARFPGNPALVEKMRAQVLPALEQLELRLRAEVEQRDGALARAGVSDKVPPGYADAVAEYFRRLSRGK